jgi:gamma-glutamylcyclotransferase (GGCT)/AIG2-like uncharacterized protein YtfP
MTQKIQLLFVYGTLKDEEMRRALFETQVPCEPACLRGYSLQSDGEFFFAFPHPDGLIRGSVLSLNEPQLALADLWEDVPSYSRVRVMVDLHDGEGEAWVYIRLGVEGRIASPEEVSSLPRDEVLKMIADFHKSRPRVSCEPSG